MLRSVSVASSYPASASAASGFVLKKKSKKRKLPDEQRQHKMTSIPFESEGIDEVDNELTMNSLDGTSEDQTFNTKEPKSSEEPTFVFSKRRQPQRALFMSLSLPDSSSADLSHSHKSIKSHISNSNQLHTNQMLSQHTPFPMHPNRLSPEMKKKKRSFSSFNPPLLHVDTANLSSNTYLFDTKSKASVKMPSDHLQQSDPSPYLSKSFDSSSFKEDSRTATETHSHSHSDVLPSISTNATSTRFSPKMPSPSLSSYHTSPSAYSSLPSHISRSSSPENQNAFDRKAGSLRRSMPFREEEYKALKNTLSLQFDAIERKSEKKGRNKQRGIQKTEKTGKEEENELVQQKLERGLAETEKQSPEKEKRKMATFIRERFREELRAEMEERARKEKMEKMEKMESSFKGRNGEQIGKNRERGRERL